MIKTVILGRICAAPELKKTKGGDVSVCEIDVASDRGKDKEADFIKVILWRSDAEFLCKYFSKGSPVCITGEITTERWEEAGGKKRSRLVAVADGVYFVPGAGGAP